MGAQLRELVSSIKRQDLPVERYQRTMMILALLLILQHHHHQSLCHLFGFKTTLDMTCGLQLTQRFNQLLMGLGMCELDS